MSEKPKLKVLKEGDLEDKISVLVGTRPSIVKMGPIIKELEKKDINSFVIHAGQHYSYNMDREFFEDLDLKEPEYLVESTKECEYHGEQTAEMLKGIEKVLLNEKPKVILVCGDANFNLAGALAGRKLRIKVGHVEAGLRSNDWRMPEEHNRVMIDHISDYLFAPTEEAKENALKDNVKGEVFVTGNTIVDAVNQNLKIAEEKSQILEKLGLTEESYFVITAHREENVDSKRNLSKLIETIEKIGENHQSSKIVYPVHPRTRKRLKEFELADRAESIDKLNLMEPLGYLDFLKLLKNARLVLTDSGGIQEESCIMQVPCVTLRENTERPETVEVGSNIVAGLEPSEVLKATEEMLSRERNWKNPFGEGTAAENIVKITTQSLTYKNKG
ncbi:UDP-N-acetylglucosamine 2-epimerase [candidate division MSBL1 archaeon SCGC-AAA259A05]|uniref:UDP-N-acetylglucosamine 2-epimerase n=1 Tax=candidate division MSBL1 archaeon SCGC-AAA259A05 TaxID=1698259 RepID=A0A133UB49_9EURY|nr:UDP-N-acetylglucosamine 2-epimerase [candidate division MSBL1 archaeon SCGC-AAA259A05]